MNLGKPVKAESLQKLIATIFAGGEVKVHQAHSDLNKELRVFNCNEEVLGYIDEAREKGDGLAYLSLHYLASAGFVRNKEVILRPEQPGEPQTRFSREGWGLIQFQLWLNNDGFTCDIGVNSEKRAIKWENIYPELKSPSLWNWKEVQRQNRRLNRVLKSCA